MKKGILIVGIAAMMAATTANAQLLDIHVGPNNNYVDQIDGSIYVDEFDFFYNQPHLIVRHMGANQINAVPTWDVGHYTGFYPEGHPQFTTRGPFDSSVEVGANAYQMEGNEVGVMINSWTYPRKTVVGGGQHTVWSYLWDPECPSTPRPWVNPVSDFTMQMELKMPWLQRWGDSNSQISFVIYGLDISQTDPQLLAILVNIHDPRGVYPEHVGDDGRPFISAPLADNQEYITKSPYSHGFQVGPWSDYRFFRVHITRDNLIASVKAMNDKSPFPFLSEDPADYIVTSVHVLHEFKNPGTSQVSMGSAYRGVMALSCSNLNCGM